MATKLFAKEVLLEEVLDSSFIKDGQYEILENDIIDQRRWVTVNYLVFKDKSDGKIYGVSYEYGSTECQDQSPFEYDDDEIECQELEPVEVVKIEYQPVKD